jgi:hypothetical protein
MSVGMPVLFIAIYDKEPLGSNGTDVVGGIADVVGALDVLLKTALGSYIGCGLKKEPKPPNADKPTPNPVCKGEGGTPKVVAV